MDGVVVLLYSLIYVAGYVGGWLFLFTSLSRLIRKKRLRREKAVRERLARYCETEVDGTENEI